MTNLDQVGSIGHHPHNCVVALAIYWPRWAYDVDRTDHMIEERARHNGRADLIRERIDGTAGV